MTTSPRPDRRRRPSDVLDAQVLWSPLLCERPARSWPDYADSDTAWPARQTGTAGPG